MERLERGRRIVREALLPTAREDTDPCEGQGAPSRLVRFALVALLLGIDVGPEGMPERCRGPCHARVSEEGRTLQAPVHPGLRATAFRDRCDARIFLACLGRGEACSLGTEGHEEALAVCHAWCQGAPRWALRDQGGGVSQCLSRSSPWSAASVGASWARRGVNASRSVATVRGLTGKSPRNSELCSADTMGPFLRARQMARGWPWNRVRRVQTHASITAGRCSRRRHSRRREPATCQPLSCVASAQSRPPTAAHAAGAWGFMGALPAWATVVRRDRPAGVLRRHEREPVTRQTLRMR